MLLRLVYLGVANAFAPLRLLPMSDRDKDAEILALRSFDRTTFSGDAQFGGATFRRDHPPIWPEGFAEPAEIVWKPAAQPTPAGSPLRAAGNAPTTTP